MTHRGLELLLRGKGGENVQWGQPGEPPQADPSLALHGLGCGDLVQRGKDTSLQSSAALPLQLFLCCSPVEESVRYLTSVPGMESAEFIWSLSFFCLPIFYLYFNKLGMQQFVRLKEVEGVLTGVCLLGFWPHWQQHLIMYQEINSWLNRFEYLFAFHTMCLEFMLLYIFSTLLNAEVFVEMWCFSFVPFVIIKIQRSCLTLSGQDLLFASRNASCKETVQSIIAGSRVMWSGQNVWHCSKLHMVTLPGIGLALTFPQTLCETFLTQCGSSEHYSLVCNSHTFCKGCYSWCVNPVLNWFDLCRN